MRRPTVKDLAEPFDVSGPAITKHLKVLERAGLISRRREGQLRPCRFEPRALASAADWIEQYRGMWEERLDRLDSYLQSLAPVPTRAPETKRHKTAGRKPATPPRGERDGHHGSDRSKK